MSEYESRGRASERARSGGYETSSGPAASRARTQAEHARDIVANVVRRTQDAELAIEAARSARTANRIDDWHDARSRIDRAIAQAEQALERARGIEKDANAEAKQELESAAARLARHKDAAVLERKEAAPTGFTTISTEAHILAIITAHVEGGVEAGFARKHQQLEAQFDRLSPIERRVLLERLTRKRENDPIATAFATRFNDRRRNSLLAQLKTADSRAVQRGERVVTQNPSSTWSIERPQVVLAEPEPEPLDAKLRRILEASHSDVTIESLFAQATTGADGTARRALAKRLESYRPGGGDEIAARFARLDRSLKQRICNGLRSESSAAPAPQPLPDPIRGELEAATGMSLAHVNVHADAHGNAVADAHGARGVAIGSDIYLGEGQFDVTSGDGRELIAHEVAHVVQAQSHPDPTRAAAKGDSESIGAAEEEADEFAAAFRQRRGAIAWSPSVGIAGGTALRAPAAGQSTIGDRKTNKTVAPKPDVAWAYLRANHDEFIASIEKRLVLVTPPAHERLAWVSGGIAARFAIALDASLDGDPLFQKLPALVHPADPWYLIDQNRTLVEGTAGVIVDGREPKGVLTWNPFVGDALAIEVVTRLRESIERMVPRYLVQLDVKQPDPVTATDLVTSHPMDRVAAALLVDEAVMKPVAAKRTAKAKGSKDPALFPNGVRFLEDWKWLGATDRNLWNWIEVKSPRDATAEDVAATLLHRDGAAPSHQAYGITSAPPFFRMEPSWARMFADAKAHAPEGVDKPHADNGLALAESALATEAAIAQAADERRFDRRGIPLPPNLERLTEVLEKSHRQLERAKQLLIPWKLWELVLPAAAWVAKHREHLLAIPSGRLVGLTPVIEGQQTILFESVGAIQQVVEAAGRSAGSEADTGPITNVLRQYAITIGESHLIDTARAQLARAQRAKAGMTLALLDSSLRESHDAVRELKSNESRMQWGGAVSATDQHAADQRQLIELHAKHAAGEAVDEADVELLSASLKEHAFDTRTKSLYLQLYNLREEVRDAGQGVIATLALALEGADISELSKVNIGELKHQMRFLEVSPKLTTLMDDLRASVIDVLPATKQDRIRSQGGTTSKHVQAWASNEAVRYAEQQLTEFVARNKLGEVVKRAVEKIEDQRIRTLIVQIGILIGVGVVGGVAGSIIGGAVRGGLLADAAVASVGMMRNAQTVGTIANIATDATVNAIGQVMVMGGSGKDAFVDNLLSNAAVRVALAPLHRAAAAWGAVEIDLQNLTKWERLGHRSKTTLAAGGLLTAEMITGAAVSYVVQRARKSDGPVDDKTAASWALEGASMVVGRFISGRLTGMEKRLAQMAEHGVHLRMKAAKLRTLAKKVDETGDKDAAMQLLVEHHKLLADEAKLLDTLHTVSNGKISRETIETLSAGNRFEREGVKGIASAALPLRLAGLTPDDASAKTWIGATEDISIALHQASLAGLSIRVLEHDAAAREWRVSFDNEVITIVESPLRGRPRPAKSDPSEADRKRAHRYADAANFMQEQWESIVKADIDKRPVVEVDHLQVGYSITGVMNQATLPDGVNKLVVYQDKGTLVGRGKQELGQSPTKWDAPGIRGSEQSPKDSQWITSEEHARSLDIGRLEAQTPAYRGSAVALEVRPKGPLGEDWKAPDRAIRVKVRDASGTERWFYTNRFDNTGGAGPGDLSQAKRVVDAKHLPGMLASGQLVRGDDPDYASKARTGDIFAWGSTPTGAWVAEAAADAGATVTMVGDTRPPRSDWSSLTAEYGELVAEVAKLPAEKVPANAKRRLQELESLIASAHSGMALARNRKKGAAYERGLHGRDGVSIEFGTPSKIEPTPDGKILVTVGHGVDAKAKVYDQVIVAHGQDPSAPGAPGSLLGHGAVLKGVDPNTKARIYEEVPEGTIALEPIWSPPKDGSNERDLLGLQSIDPPGIRLLGAAYASKKLSPWVRQSDRAAFEAAIDRMSAPAAPTRDHGPISEHSTGVTTGIERQRDHVPRANETTEATRFRLPGPERTLELDADRSKWDDQVRDWFAIHLRADHQWVRVQRFTDGRSGAVVYRVTVGENEVGVFKIFDTKDGAKNEQEMLKLLASAKLKKMKVVGERGRMSVDPKAKMGDALLMDVAKGTSIRQLIERMPSDPEQRKPAFEQLAAAMRRTGEGLAEMHAKFGSKAKSGAPTLMTNEAKLSDANYMLDTNFRGGRDTTKVKAALGEDFERVKAALEGPMLQAFLDAKVPASAYHGDANAGNFIVDDYNKEIGRFKDLGVIDVESMKWSVEGNKGTKTGAADVARLLESLEAVQPGTLSSDEVSRLRNEFMKVYRASFRTEAGYELDAANHALAERWYRLEFEVAVLKSDPRAKDRILKIIGTEKR